MNFHIIFRVKKFRRLSTSLLKKYLIKRIVEVVVGAVEMLEAFVL